MEGLKSGGYGESCLGMTLEIPGQSLQLRLKQSGGAAGDKTD